MKHFIAALFLIITGAFPLASQSQTVEESPRAVVHLLEYLAADYAGAVQNGKVLSQDEYAEQVEFIGLIEKMLPNIAELSALKDLKQDVATLRKYIDSKAAAEKVADLARKIKRHVIDKTKLTMAPTRWPDLNEGKKIFEGSCTSCHGMTGGGDGPLAKDLNPAPRSFLDQAYMSDISPAHSFNVIKLGIPGTGMLAFKDFTDQEAWNLAFYVMSMRSKAFNQDEPMISLEETATLSENQIREKYEDREPEKIIANVRGHSGGPGSGDSLRVATKNLKLAEKAYESGNHKEAERLAIMAYLEGIEPVEPQLKAQDADAVTQLERQMMKIRGLIDQKAELAILSTAISEATASILKAESSLKTQESFWLTFSLAAGIVFREGFEAILIILAILGVIRATGAKRATAMVHGGWLAALALGLVAWTFSGWVLKISGAQRELSEGIASFLAVVVLLYMGFWLHSKSEIGRWKKFIDGKVKASLEGASRWGLFFLSFIAVFREALETVLFMRALTVNGESQTQWAMGLGVFASFGTILFFAWVLLKLSVNLPIRRLLSISSWMMVILSIILIGKGIRAFQETGLISVTNLGFEWQVPWIGVYPTAETVMAQALLMIACAALWFIASRPTPVRQTNE